MNKKNTLGATFLLVAMITSISGVSAAEKAATQQRTPLPRVLLLNQL